MSPVNNLGTVEVYTKKVKPRLRGANGGASVKCAGKVRPLPWEQQTNQLWRPTPALLFVWHLDVRSSKSLYFCA